MRNRLLALQKRLWPLSRGAALVVILSLILSGVTSALIIRHAHNNSTPDVQTAPSSQVSTEATQTTSAQNTTPTTSAQATPPTTKSSGKSTTSNLPDQYGCIPQTSGYDNCVAFAKKNAFSMWCSGQSKIAGDTYIAQSAGAKPAYDTVMAEWNAVKDQPYQTHSPYEEYAADAKTKYNAIEKPAYATYTNTINSLNAQGCSEIMVYSDTSWAGY